MSAQVSDLFEREPYQWGMRGDPYVWREMRARLEGVAVPDRWWTLRALLAETFRDVVGVDLDTSQEEAVHRPELDHGGMSGGAVHLVTWRQRLLPILVDRSGLH
jgi:hypothetical protein